MKMINMNRRLPALLLALMMLLGFCLSAQAATTASDAMVPWAREQAAP